MTSNQLKLFLETFSVILTSETMTFKTRLFRCPTIGKIRHDLVEIPLLLLELPPLQDFFVSLADL